MKELDNENLNIKSAEGLEEEATSKEQTEAPAEASVITETETEKLDKKARRAAKKEAKRLKEEQKSLLQNILETVAFAAIVFLIALLIKNYVGQPIMVSGNSMNDTLSNHDWVWANKLFYTPKRFDVVIVENEKTNNKLYIKRVIGLPGDTVELGVDNSIKINGQIIEDPYGYYTGANRLMFAGTWELGKDEYFVMGDNRYNSTDSRIIGPVKRNDIKGHAVVRIWPFSKLGDFDKSNVK